MTPSPLSGDSLPGPESIVRRELSNGMVVLIRENFNARSVVITGTLSAGSLFDPPDRDGLALFTAAMLLRGTEQRDFGTIHELLEGSGASLAISGGRHAVGFSGKSLAEDLPILFELLSDALRHPVFPEAQMERLRGQLVTGIKIREQDTRYVAGRLFRQLVYTAQHPYGVENEGTLDSIARITRDDIVRFHRTYYGPQQMLLSVVGAVDADTVMQWVDAHFGDWMYPDQPTADALPPVPVLESRRSQAVAMPGKSQADVVLGVVGPSRFANDWQAASLANNILGVFGMFGRIGAEVREKRGMAYYCYSRLDGGPGPGAWRIIAGINPINVNAAIEVIRGELRRITSELVSEKELEDSKANFIGRLPLQLETNDGVAGIMLTMERYHLGLDYLHRFAGEIQAVSREEVLEAAQRYLDPDAYALAIAGPEIADTTP